MTLAHLRNGDTLTRLAAGFAVSVTTAWRYLREAVDLLAAHAEDLAAATRRPAQLGPPDASIWPAGARSAHPSTR